ncbi:enoyl-CoA hydratase/isomerase family protein [Pseudomonas sp. BN102]|nr:enoyl-CoA hydratase/isomerase family protein [Pseudomonas sp. BN102]MDH4609128.1 enoyl-CoA hydratase/isomerase family protein [Pseudomonas sp. BN102]
MSSLVSLSRVGSVAVIRVDNPPVNALSQPVRAGLLQAFAEAGQDAAVELILLYCSGRTFIAGADIREFGQPPQAPLLPDVTLAIENCAKPTLAVLHGSALGGGLEVAMACHYRIARRDARVGLPEVKLGLLPGAGGTQRLPRLAGVELALEMIVGGEPISAEAALRHGIVDQLFDGELLDAGLACTAALLARGAGPRRSGQAVVPAPERGNHSSLLAARRAKVLARQPDAFSPPRCIDAIEAAIQLPLEQGLRRERELFLQCLESPQRAQLVARFFAEREVARAGRQSADQSEDPLMHQSRVSP